MASPAHMKIDNKQLFEAMALPTQLKIDEQQLFEAIVLPTQANMRGDTGSGEAVCCVCRACHDCLAKTDKIGRTTFAFIGRILAQIGVQRTCARCLALCECCINHRW